MKKYVDRLARVLGVRQVQEKQARTRVAQARREMLSARSHERVSRERFEEHQLIDGPIPYLNHRFDRTLWELRATAVLDAEEQVRVSEQFVAARLQEWSAAAKSVEALERLDERRREEHRHEVDLEERREADDLVNSRHREEDLDE